MDRNTKATLVCQVIEDLHALKIATMSMRENGEFGKSGRDALGAIETELNQIFQEIETVIQEQKDCRHELNT